MRSATIYLAGQCNLKCKHCLVGNDHVDPRSALSTADAITVLTRLRAANVSTITLLGGEITIYRSDLPQILAHCDHLGLRVSINTNGLALPRLLSLLQHASLGNITVSLDGASSTTHDFLRGPGTFAKTVSTIRALRSKIRKPKTLNMTFTLNDQNYHEYYAIIELANTLEVDTLNVQEVRLSGVAAKHAKDLATDMRGKFYAAVKLLLSWRMIGKTGLSFHIPPAFGQYMQERFGEFGNQANFRACGGTDTYGYVDLLGNHLPCPAMSYEENPSRALSVASPRLSILENDVDSIWESSVFKGFNRSVQRRHRIANLRPCDECIFADRCSPCTAPIISGQPFATVDLCMGVKTFGDEYLSGISQRIFGIAHSNIIRRHGAQPDDAKLR
jgi:MoaA/NifB/PqqE/SkfB family radical SAM enzyme